MNALGGHDSSEPADDSGSPAVLRCRRGRVAEAGGLGGRFPLQPYTVP